MEQRSPKWVRAIVIGLVCIGIPAAVLHWGPESAPVSTHHWTYIHLRVLHFELRNFATDNADQLPTSLATLEPRLVATGRSLDDLRFRETETKSRYDWLYFPAAKLSSLPDDYILVATPKTVSSGRWQKVRVILHPNGTISDVKENEFQERIHRQTSAKVNH